jgi:tRNA(Ile)-lysidine synthase TilS/MesJ
MKLMFLTAQGRYELPAHISSCQHFTLKDVCTQAKIPYASVCFYGISPQRETTSIVGLEKTLAELSSDFMEIAIQPDRNIHYPWVILKDKIVSQNPQAVTEYSFPSETSDTDIVHMQMSQDDCQAYTAYEVSQFIESFSDFDPDKKIVLGVSGGGDSNTLIRSLLKHPKIKKENLIAVMMLGIPDWDKGLPRAQDLCHTYGVPFRCVNTEQVSTLLNKKGTDWVGDFEKVFPQEDMEVIGTLAIRLALTHVAKEVGAQAIVIGLNLEDLISESLLHIMGGKLPSPFPVRCVDGMKIWYPLYNIPKKILDGCYPKFSLQNYQDRYPSLMSGRAIPYYLAQMMHTLLPGVEFDLIRGLGQLSRLNQTYAHFDASLGFSVAEPLGLDVRHKWETFLKL